jgi:DNA-directed RNA polymerase subunit RPC12/RpoP
MWNKHNCINCGVSIDDFVLKSEQRRSGLECPSCYIEHKMPHKVSAHVAYSNELAIYQQNKARKNLELIQNRLKKPVKQKRQQLLLQIEGV